jgi:hypothetical protein
MPTRAELAENTGAYLLPRPSYETVVTDDYTYVAGPMSGPILDRLGFERHGEIRLYADRLRPG